MHPPRTSQAPEAQTTPQTAPEVTSEPQVPATDSAPTVAEKESAPDIAAVVTLDDFELPLRKKKRRPVSFFPCCEFSSLVCFVYCDWIVDQFYVA